MRAVHFTDSYLLNPQHEITVALIGAGGTGSQVLTCLGRMNTALKALSHPGLFITMYDPDMVTPANMGRQLFTEQD
jgi:molybdopterin/thiamine biosynthesis adenylyltransferase